MEELRLFRCDTCGFTSAQKKEVEECEAKHACTHKHVGYKDHTGSWFGSQWALMCLRCGVYVNTVEPSIEDLPKEKQEQVFNLFVKETKGLQRNKE